MTPEKKLAKLETLTLDQLRHEVGVIHGVIPFGHGYASMVNWGDERILFAKEIEPGIWIKVMFCAYWSPGWSWYISDKPDTTYVERGGGCTGDEARVEAEEYFSLHREELT